MAVGLSTQLVLFTLLERIALRALPYPEADRLVELTFTAPGMGIEAFGLSLGTFAHFDREIDELDALGLYQPGHVDLSALDWRRRIPAAQSTPSVLQILGAVPAVGRTLNESDARPGAEPVALLTHDLWGTAFGGGEVVGRTLTVDGRSHRVVGVLQAGFRLPFGEADLITPLAFDASGAPFGGFTYRSVGRRAEGGGGTLDDALRGAVGSFPAAFPGEITAGEIESMQMATVVTPLKEAVLDGVGRSLWMLWGVALCVVLIAVTNVANLFRARAAGRRTESTVRIVLGAGSAFRRPFVVEGIAVTLVGGLLGLALARLLLTTLLLDMGDRGHGRSTPSPSKPPVVITDCLPDAGARWVVPNTDSSARTAL